MSLNYQKIDKQVAAVLVLLLYSLFYSNSAKSEGYCVACYSPDFVYQCLIEGKQNTSSVDPRHQILCIKLIAQEGGHERCSVERFTNEGCKGALRIVDADTSTLKPVAGTKTAAGSDNASGINAPSASDADKERKTSDASKGMSSSEPSSSGPVENLTKSPLETTKGGLATVTDAIKDTTVKTGEKIKSFASSLGHATKKTWNCLASLFTNC